MSGLATGELTWRRLGVLVRHLPRVSSTVRAQRGADAEWGALEHLTAAAVDALRVANWQRSGRRGAPRPKPIQRPGQGPQRFGTPVPVDRMRQILDNWSTKEG